MGEGRMQKQLLTVNLLTLCPFVNIVFFSRTHRFSVQKSSFSFWEYIACRIEILAITCYFFSGEISHFCLLPINKSAVLFTLKSATYRV